MTRSVTIIEEVYSKPCWCGFAKQFQTFVVGVTALAAGLHAAVLPASGVSPHWGLCVTATQF